MLNFLRKPRDPMSMPDVPKRGWLNPKQQNTHATGWFRFVSEVLIYSQIVAAMGAVFLAYLGYWWIALGVLAAMVPIGLWILRREKIAPVPEIKDGNIGYVDLQ